MSEEKIDAWMPLWIGAYLADTMHLSRDSHGGYLLLLFAYWRNKGPLPDDDEDLAGITKATASEWKKLRPKLAKFFDVEGGQWRHGRADKELTKAGMLKAAAVSKAKAGAQARWSKSLKKFPEDAPSIPQALPEDCPTPLPSSLRSETKDSGSEAPASFAGATAAGSLCLALKAAGIGRVAPGNIRLTALLDAGATEAEFLAHAPKALEKGDDAFSYLIGIVEGERKRAAVTAGQLHRGPMANRQQALENRNRAVADEWSGATTEPT